MKKRSVVAAVTGIAMFATAAFAAVNFDVPNGTGFVGKGDVQLAFGWNNKTLQANASDVGFEYDSVDRYIAVCTFITAEGKPGEKTHNVEHKKRQGVRGVINGDPRQKTNQNQFTGFDLLGYIGDPVTIGGAIPVKDGVCPGNPGHDGTWTSVEKVESASSGGLFATHGVKSVELEITPAATI